MNPTSYNVIKDTSGLRPMGDPEDRAAMDKLSVEGKVVQRAECCPNNSSLYSAIKKDALLKAGEPKRMVKQLDKHVTTSFKPVANHAANLAHERQKKAEGKKMRDDKEKVGYYWLLCNIRIE